MELAERKKQSSVHHRTRRAGYEVYRGLEEIKKSVPASWMGSDETGAVRSIYIRQLNGVALAESDFEKDEILSIDRAQADAVIDTLPAINAVIELIVELNQREAFGDTDGLMLAVGRIQ